MTPLLPGAGPGRSRREQGATLTAARTGERAGRTTVRVTTLGEEVVEGATGACVVEDFPSPGETVTLEWQESQQNFVITDVE